MRKVLVTGADGFVGRVLCARLVTDGYFVQSVVRARGSEISDNSNQSLQVVGNIGSPDIQWSAVLTGVDCIVHLAAHVHVKEGKYSTLAHYRETNVDATERLARAGVKAGVRRFVFISSIGVNGNQTASSPFSVSDDPRPVEPYAISKWEAEQALKAICSDSGMELIVLRSPLVYGPGVKANFLSLLRLVDRAFILPFGAVKNRRTFLFVGNLADAIAQCVDHPKAAGRTFLLGDEGEVSLPELVCKISNGFGRRCRLLAVPIALLRCIGWLTGKSSSIDKLTSSLIVDTTAIRETLAWKPPFSIDEGLKVTCDWYAKEYGRPTRNFRW